MRKLSILISLLFLVIFAEGQEPTITDELIELSTPSYPAMSIMGTLPQEINKPKSYNQLETTLINSFSQEGSFGIPRNFGLEVMPYWLKSKPYKEFSYEKLSKNQCAPLENLALSMGTVNENIGDTLFNTKIGFGVRTLIFSGKVAKNDLDSIRVLKEAFLNKSFSHVNLIFVLTIIQNESFNSYQNFISKLEEELRKSMIDTDSIEIEKEVSIAIEYVETVFPAEKWTNNTKTEQVANEVKTAVNIKLNEEEFTSLAKNIEDQQTRKYGFFWEIAMATYLDFPYGNIDYSLVPKLGIWTTATYRLPSQKVDFIGTFRFIKDFQLENEAFNLDYGGALIFHVHKFSFAGEYLQRFQSAVLESSTNDEGYKIRTSKTRFDYRATLNISYQISPGVVVAYSFGKNFGFSDNNSNDLINQLSINFGLGRVPLKL